MPVIILIKSINYCKAVTRGNLHIGFLTLAAIFVGMGKGGLPVIATLGVPSLSLIMSPITAAGLLLPVYIVLIYLRFLPIAAILTGLYFA